MGNKLKDNKPRGLKPVQRIELSEDNAKRRFILAVVFALIGAIAIAIGVGFWLRTEPGWKQIEAKASGASSAQDLVFNYYFADEEISASKEEKELTALYSELCVKAYEVFNRYDRFEDGNNLFYVNEHINKEVKVDPVLYGAFETMLENGGRYLYFGALHSEYEYNFFGHEDVPQSEDLDPYKNGEMADYFGTLAEYALDPDSVELELLGDNTVKLKVSKQYKDFAKENEISVFIDFYRMKNAFVVDYIASELQKAGYTKGTISSYDGFVRCLDTRSETYALNLFDRKGSEVYNAAAMKYQGPMAIVNLRSFPMGEKDSYDFYVRSDGKLITPYVDVDGLYKTSTECLVSYSKTKTCAEIALSLLPVFIADELDSTALTELEDKGISSVWFEDLVICKSDSGLVITDLYDDGSVKYTLQN